MDRKSWSILIVLFTSLENTVFHNQREYKNQKRMYTHQFSDSVIVRQHHFSVWSTDSMSLKENWIY